MTSGRTMFMIVFVFIGATLFARFMEGAFFGSEDVTILNNLAVIKDVQVLNLFSVPAPNLSFFTEGLPHLITWDYPFFGGTNDIFKYFLYAISVCVVWGILIIFVGVLSQRFGR